MAVALPGPGPQPRDTEGEESAAPALGTLRLSDFSEGGCLLSGAACGLGSVTMPNMLQPVLSYYLVACCQGLRVALRLWQCHVTYVLQPNVGCPLRSVTLPMCCSRMFYARCACPRQLSA